MFYHKSISFINVNILEMKSLGSFIYKSLIALILIAGFSCNKEELKPVVSLANNPGYQANDTILSVGDTIKVLLDISWNGTHRVKEVMLNVNDQLAGKYPIDIDQGQFSIPGEVPVRHAHLRQADGHDLGMGN